MAWAPYTPGRRVYRELSEELRSQLNAIPKVRSFDGVPCRVTLDDGSEVDRVYVQNAQSYIDNWGVWPDDDSVKRAIDIARVVGIADSPLRLPVDIAARLYEAGESGMGYSVFMLIFADGEHRTYVTGNAVDFVPLPAGKTAHDIIDVRPHEGDRRAAVPGLDYSWCLYGAGVGHISTWRESP